MLLHTEYTAGTAQPGAVMALLTQVRTEVAVMPSPSFSRTPNTFSHIFSGGYAAGYYSYKWAEVLDAALREARQGPPRPVIYMSPRGAPLTQARARVLAQGNGVTLICGRFEGVDQRVLDAHDIEEISIGDYVLTGGEIAAQVLIDATVRLIPRVLGNQESLAEESFSDGLLEHPQYTKPALWEGRAIPEVLLSGNHAAIATWRRDMAERLTKERRPDLWRAYGETRMDPAKDRQLSGASDQSRDYREQPKEPKR